eukprot:3033048-Prymnesium_polylepis.1
MAFGAMSCRVRVRYRIRGAPEGIARTAMRIPSVPDTFARGRAKLGERKRAHILRYYQSYGGPQKE